MMITEGLIVTPNGLEMKNLEEIKILDNNGHAISSADIDFMESSNKESKGGNGGKSNNENKSDIENKQSNSNINTNKKSNDDSKKVTDKDIALELVSKSKATIMGISKVLTEATNNDLRKTLNNVLTASVNSHYRLSDIVRSKGWYADNTNPMEKLKEDLSATNMMME